MGNIEWEMTRLRWRLKIRENIVARLAAENERLRTLATDATPSKCSVHPRLTDDEREAIVWCLELIDDLESTECDTLRELLERLS
jgi:hypothetical protein